MRLSLLASSTSRSGVVAAAEVKGEVVVMVLREEDSVR